MSKKSWEKQLQW